MMKSAPVSVVADNPLDAVTGDRVVVASDTRSILGAAALVYLLPILFFFAGYFVARGNGWEESSALLTGGCCFLLSGVILAFAECRMKSKKQNLFTIVEICRD